MSHKSRRRGVATGLGLAVGSALTAEFISEAAAPIALADGTLPAAPPAPEQLPEAPPAPLSYLSDLVEQVGQPEPLTFAQQHQIPIQLQPALRSADPEEREGGSYVLKMFSRRDDLYANVDRTLAELWLADHLDVAARLEEVRRTAQRRKALVDEMTALHQAGQWGAVVAATQELPRLDPEHPDPGGIVSDAKAKIRDADLSELYGQAWQEAADLFSAIKTAEQQRHLAARLDQAEAAAGDDDWDTAVTALENLCAVDPAYRDAGARLGQARSARSVKQLRLLVDEMTALHQAGRWKEVLAAEKLDPDHPDPGGIVSDAQAKIRDAQYAEALNHLDQQHWQQAAEVFTAKVRVSGVGFSLAFFAGALAIAFLAGCLAGAVRHAAACSLRAARRPRRRSLAPAEAALPVDRKVDRTGYRHDCRDNDCGPAPADNPCCV
jgi:hypothetical protein